MDVTTFTLFCQQKEGCAREKENVSRKVAHVPRREEREPEPPAGGSDKQANKEDVARYSYTCPLHVFFPRRDVHSEALRNNSVVAQSVFAVEGGRRFTNE